MLKLFNDKIIKKRDNITLYVDNNKLNQNITLIEINKQLKSNK